MKLGLEEAIAAAIAKHVAPYHTPSRPGKTTERRRSTESKWSTYAIAGSDEPDGTSRVENRFSSALDTPVLFFTVSMQDAIQIRAI